MVRKLVIAVVVVVALLVIGGVTGVLDLQALRQRLTSRDTWSDLKTKAQREEVRLKAEAQRLTRTATPEEESRAADLCRQNLRRFESAKRAIASRTGVETGAVSWDAVLKEMGTPMPVCPRRGTYTLGFLEQLPRCSIGANGTPDPKDDHAIQSF